ncbi:hypothetical protein [Peterkaempfera griseoplana]|uniref:hypothetical protein n=1 Tax=Peterkaempfera griseoplana TaxID=66896 RepID=UPI0006E40603|nr:hypothetical protein [Peterkaempfera griseoplana]
MNVERRLGPSPRERGCAGGGGCPDLFELADGNFAVIGAEATAALIGSLPADAGVGGNERIVVIPRELLVRAKAEIPDL